MNWIFKNNYDNYSIVVDATKRYVKFKLIGTQIQDQHDAIHNKLITNYDNW